MQKPLIYNLFPMFKSNSSLFLTKTITKIEYVQEQISLIRYRCLLLSDTQT